MDLIMTHVLAGFIFPPILLVDLVHSVEIFYIGQIHVDFYNIVDARTGGG